MNRSLVIPRSILVAVITASLAACVPNACGDFFDNDSSDGAWETATNWDNDVLPAGVSAEMFLEDQNNALPNVNGIPTVTLSSGSQSPSSVVLGGGSDTDFGDIQFLLTGGALNLSSDSRVGRGGTDPTINNSTAYFTQTDGDVVVTGGSGVDIKLGAGGQPFSPGAIYSISGGSLNSSGTINLGSNSTLAGDIIFEIDGSGASSIVIEDFKTESAVSGPVFFGVVLDAGGMTTLVANDDFQMENVGLQLSLSDVPPSGPIVLVQADRLSNDNQFIGLPDGSIVSASFGGTDYEWFINYFDSSDDGTILDAIVLNPVPEPSTFLFGCLALVSIALRRRR